MIGSAAAIVAIADVAGKHRYSIVVARAVCTSTTATCVGASASIVYSNTSIADATVISTTSSTGTTNQDICD